MASTAVFNAIIASIPSTAAAGSTQFTVGGKSFSVNINIATGTPTGTLTAKMLNTALDTVSAVASSITIPVNAGLFLNGSSTFTWSSGASQPAVLVDLIWTPSGTPAGSITVAGTSK